MNLAINLTKRKNVKAHTLKTTKYHWNKLKIQINGEVYHAHGLEGSVLLEWQFSWNCSVDSKQ